MFHQNLIVVCLIVILPTHGVLGFEHPFLSSDPWSPKDLQGHGQCFYSDRSTTNLIDIRLTVHESDLTLKTLDNDGTPLEFVSWSCSLVDEKSVSAYHYFYPDEDYIFDELSFIATDCNGLGTRKINFIPQGDLSGTSNTDIIQDRTHIIEINDVANDAASSAYRKCGGWQYSNKDIFYAARCTRDTGYNQLGDVVVRFIIDGTKCLPRQLDSDYLLIRNVEKTTLTRHYDVTASLQYGDNMYMSPYGPYLQIADLNAAFMAAKVAKTATSETTATLGQSLYVEVCVALGAASTQIYFRNGYDPLGLHIHSCTVKPQVGDTLFETPNTIFPLPLTDANGCGLASPFARQWTTSKYVFGYGPGDVDASKPYLASPNCFRSEIFEAVSLMRLNVDAKLPMELACRVDYCRSITDPLCFGTKSGNNYDYSSKCSNTGGKRRKRQSTDDLAQFDLPSEISINFTILTVKENQNAVQEPVKTTGCIKKTVFIALASGIGLVDLILLATFLFLCYRYRNMKKARALATSSSTPSRPKGGDMSVVYT